MAVKKSIIGSLNKLTSKISSKQKSPEESSQGEKNINGAVNVARSLPLIKWGIPAAAIFVVLLLAGGALTGAGNAISSTAGASCNTPGANTKAIAEAEGMGIVVEESIKTQAGEDYGNACQGTGYNTQTYPPTTGVITTLFGVKDALHPNGHNGMDIAGGCDAPIYAFAGGVVTTVVAGSEAKSTAGAYVSPAGKVIIKHTEEFSSMYYHVKGSTTTVQVGDVVNAGDQIATQWSNGQSTGCHLHLEMYENGTRIDANVVLAAAGYTYSWTDPFTQAMMPPKPIPGDSQAVNYTPGSVKQMALTQVLAKGWQQSEFDNCLVPLWEKESNWRVNALNPKFSPSNPPTPEFQAYGIVQAAPGSKMATAGPDWLTNPNTQITWGIGYIEDRYGTPCGAWAHSGAFGWY